MKQWATKQMKGELLTARAAAVMGVAIVFLAAVVIAAVNWMKDEMRVHPVSTAAQALEAQEAGWIAEVEYAEKLHLGTATLETTRQGEITFMMGGAVGAVPGMTRTSEQDYQLWALQAEDFTALCFSVAQEIPDSGRLRMDSVIDWLKEEERTELVRDFSAAGRNAYVFLLQEPDSTKRAIIGFAAAALLICCGIIAWLLLAPGALRLTELWKAMAKTGEPEKIREELDEPLYARMGFAISTNYICVSGRVLLREGMRCAAEKDEAGDEKFVFNAANGWTEEYYPDEEELKRLHELLGI